MKYSCIIAGLASVLLSYTSQAKEGYPQPTLGRVILHLDRLPIDVDQMRSISRTLAQLATISHDGSRQQLRVRAQLLALAIRLDAKNQEAIKYNKMFIQGMSIPSLGENEKNLAIARLVRMINALSQAEQHSEALTLALYLKDVLYGLNPVSPVVKGHQVDKGRWRHVLQKSPAMPAREEITQNSKDAEPQSSPEQITDTKKELTDQDKKERDDKPMLKWMKNHQRITSPLYLVHSNPNGEKHVLELVDLNLDILEHHDEKIPLILHMEPAIDKVKAAELGKQLGKMLQHQLGKFNHVKLDLTLSNCYSAKSGKAILFPLLIESVASLQNLQIQPGVIVIGDVNYSGKVIRSDQFWQRLKVIRRSAVQNQILICPAETRDLLQQLIVLEESDFFLKNEVIGVTSLKEAVQISSKLKDPNLLAAHEEFKRLRAMVGTRSVGSYTVKPSFKQALQKILRLNPNHISAQMLLVRGDSRRAKRISRDLIGEELRSVMKLLEYVYHKPVKSLSVKKLEEVSVALKNKIDELSKYIDPSDRVVFRALEKMLTELNSMKRSRGKVSAYHVRSANNAHQRFVAQLDIVKEALK